MYSTYYEKLNLSLCHNSPSTSPSYGPQVASFHQSDSSAEKRHSIHPDWSFLTSEYLAITPVHWLQYEPQPCTIHYLIAIIYTLIFIPGSIANLVMVTFFFRIPSLQTPPNLLNLNLAIADLLMNSQIPGIIYNSFTCKPSFGVWGCKLHAFFSGWAGTVAIVTICAMSVERYIKISKPFASANFVSFSSMIVAIVLIWIYGLIFASVPLIFENTITSYVPEGYLTTCTFDYLTHRIAGKVFIFIFFIAAYVLPLSIILYSYQSIIFTVRKNRNLVIQGMLGSPRLIGNSSSLIDRMKEGTGTKEFVTFENSSYCEPVRSTSSPNYSISQCPPKSSTVTLTPMGSSIAVGSVMDVRMKFMQQQQQNQLLQKLEQVDCKSIVSSNESISIAAHSPEVKLDLSDQLQGTVTNKASTFNNESQLDPQARARSTSPVTLACPSTSSFSSPPNCPTFDVVHLVHPRSTSNGHASNGSLGPTVRGIASSPTSLSVTQYLDEGMNDNNLPSSGGVINSDVTLPLDISSDIHANKNINFGPINNIQMSKIVESEKQGENNNSKRPISSASVHRYVESMSLTEKKLAKCSLVLISIWTIAWTPYAIVALIGIFTDASLLTPSASMFPAVLCKTASLFDPIFYSYSHPKYRELMSLHIRSLGRCICKPLGVCLTYASYFLSRIFYRRPYDARKSKVSVRRRSVIKRKANKVIIDKSKFKNEQNDQHSNAASVTDTTNLNLNLRLDKAQNRELSALICQSKCEGGHNLSQSRESTFSFTKSEDTLTPQLADSLENAIPLDVIVHKVAYDKSTKNISQTDQMAQCNSNSN